jgi:hypothetical protein
MHRRDRVAPIRSALASGREARRQSALHAVDFGFKVGLAEFEKSKRYGK